MAAGTAENHGGGGGLEKLPLDRIEINRGGEPTAASGNEAVVATEHEQSPGRLDRLGSRHAGVDDSGPHGGCTIEGLARCRQFHGGAGPDQPCEADGASPSG